MCAVNQYLLVEAQGAQGLFDCAEAFPALGRGCSYWRVLAWKASTQIPKIRTERWSKLQKQNKHRGQGESSDQCAPVALDLNKPISSAGIYVHQNIHKVGLF